MLRGYVVQFCDADGGGFLNIEILVFDCLLNWCHKILSDLFNSDAPDVLIANARKKGLFLSLAWLQKLLIAMIANSGRIDVKVHELFQLLIWGFDIFGNFWKEHTSRPINFLIA